MKLQEKMFALVEAWQVSQMSKREFLSDKGIRESKFNYWLCKYHGGRNIAQANLPAQDTPRDFKTFVVPHDRDMRNTQSIRMEIDTPLGLHITIY